MDELERAQRPGRQRDLAPVLGPALERADADRGRVQVDVARPERKDLREPGAGVRQHQAEGLPLGARLPGRGGQEPLALPGRQVFAPAPVDEPDRALDHDCDITAEVMPGHRNPGLPASARERRSGLAAGWGAAGIETLR